MSRPRGEQRVAVLEDDGDLRDTICEALERFGYVPVPYPSGEAFMERLPSAATELDVLIADVGLGGMDGIETVRAAREARPDLAVVYVSGDLRPLVRATDKRQISLMKPFTAETLLQVLHSLLG